MKTLFIFATLLLAAHNFGDVAGGLHCKDPKPPLWTWACHDGHNYGFWWNHQNFAESSKICENNAAYMADVHSQEESDFITGKLRELNALSPACSGHYWLGGQDLDGDGIFEWISGEPMVFTNWVNGLPQHRSQPYIHLSQGDKFKYCWNSKNDTLDRNNGVICKKWDPENCFI